jgi:hypothetical protein
VGAGGAGYRVAHVWTTRKGEGFLSCLNTASCSAHCMLGARYEWWGQAWICALEKPMSHGHLESPTNHSDRKSTEVLPSGFPLGLAHESEGRRLSGEGSEDGALAPLAPCLGALGELPVSGRLAMPALSPTQIPCCLHPCTWSPSQLLILLPSLDVPSVLPGS